jgi:hypothetical protein
MLTRAKPSLDLGIAQVRVEESGYFFVCHDLPVSLPV